MAARRTILLVVCFWLSAVAGCAFGPALARGKSPLAPIKLPVESAAIEIVTIRHPYEQPELNQELWEQLDETQVPTDVRRRLGDNGLRAGVISGSLPAELERLLRAKATADPANSANSPTEAAARLETQPLVRRTTRHLLPEQKFELVASGIYERWPLLTKEDGDVVGNVYPQAQGLFAVKADLEGDSRLRLRLVPEVQFGDARQQFVGEDGIFRVESGRQKITFDKMPLDIRLGEGQWLVLGAQTDREGSLGHRFFTESHAGRLQQKLLLVRFAGTKFDNLLFNKSNRKTNADLD